MISVLKVMFELVDISVQNFCAISLSQSSFSQTVNNTIMPILQLRFSVPLEMNKTNKVCNLEIKKSTYTHWNLMSHLLTSYGANKEGNCKYIGIQSCQ